jgi:hypothetical protein
MKGDNYLFGDGRYERDGQIKTGGAALDSPSKARLRAMLPERSRHRGTRPPGRCAVASPNVAGTLRVP